MLVISTILPFSNCPLNTWISICLAYLWFISSNHQWLFIIWSCFRLTIDRGLSLSAAVLRFTSPNLRAPFHESTTLISRNWFVHRHLLTLRVVYQFLVDDCNWNCLLHTKSFHKNYRLLLLLRFLSELASQSQPSKKEKIRRESISMHDYFIVRT